MFRGYPGVHGSLSQIEKAHDDGERREKEKGGKEEEKKEEGEERKKKRKRRRGRAEEEEEETWNRAPGSESVSLPSQKTITYMLPCALQEGSSH